MLPLHSIHTGLGCWQMNEEALSSGELLAGAAPDKGLLLCWKCSLIIIVGAEEPSHGWRDELSAWQFSRDP